MTATFETLLLAIDQSFRNLAWLGLDVLGLEASTLVASADATLTSYGVHRLPDYVGPITVQPEDAVELLTGLEKQLREVAQWRPDLDMVLRAYLAADLVRDAYGEWLRRDVTAED